MKKIAVCTPVCGPPSWHYIDSMNQWQMYHFHEHGLDIGYVHIRPGRALPIDVARNVLVQQMLSTDCTHMWMLDQDAAWLPGTLDRLMSWDIPIVGATAMMRLPEGCWPMALKGRRPDGKYRIQGAEIYEFIGQHHDPLTNQPQMLDVPPADSLLETLWTGCHCLLVQRDVLERMEPPWFQGYDPGGEDEYFCKKALSDLGIKTYVDMSVIVGHATTDRIIGAFDFMTALRFMNELERERARDAQAAEPAAWERVK